MWIVNKSELVWNNKRMYENDPIKYFYHKKTDNKLIFKERETREIKHNYSRIRCYGGIISSIIDNKVKYILVKGRYSGKWSFPKGHLNKGETTYECTLREIREETGLENLTESLGTIQLCYGEYNLFIVEEEVELNPRDKNEIEEAKWFSVEEMNGLKMNADAGEFVKRMTM